MRSDDEIILSDNGSEFAELLDCGFAQRLKYPAPLHQWLPRTTIGCTVQRSRSGIDFKNDAWPFSPCWLRRMRSKSIWRRGFRRICRSIPVFERGSCRSFDLLGTTFSFEDLVQERWSYLFRTGQDPRRNYRDHLPDRGDDVYNCQKKSVWFPFEANNSHLNT